MYCRLKNIRTVYIVVLYSNIVSSWHFVLLYIFLPCAFFFVLCIFSCCSYFRPVYLYYTNKLCIKFTQFGNRREQIGNCIHAENPWSTVHGYPVHIFLFIFFCLIIFLSSTYFRPVHIIVLYKYYISTHIVANCRIRQYRMYCNRHQTNF